MIAVIPATLPFGWRMLNRLVASSLQVQVNSQASDSETLLQPKSRVTLGLPCSVNGHGHGCSMLRHERPSWQQEQDLLGTGGMFCEGTIAQTEATRSIEASPFRGREGEERPINEMLQDFAMDILAYG
jgi:hypothetical protein